MIAGSEMGGLMNKVEALEKEILSGLSLHQAREKLGISRREAQRIARENDLHRHVKVGAKRTWTEEQLIRAKAFLDDGASYREASRSTGVPKTTLIERFPEAGWTLSEAGKFGTMLLKTGGRVR